MLSVNIMLTVYKVLQHYIIYISTEISTFREILLLNPYFNISLLWRNNS